MQNEAVETEIKRKEEGRWREELNRTKSVTKRWKEK